MPGFEGLLTGHVLVDRYRIGEVIGRGGFAAVYRAVDERLEREVAIKVITLSASNPEAREAIQRRFHREARAIARLHHANVVAVYDFGSDSTLGLDFLVMELLEGETLSERLAHPEPIPVETALRILRDVAIGVNEGHRMGLIHRDLKPSNIFLARADHPDWPRVCVLDFGIARFNLGDDTSHLTRSGGVFLSPAYASPEQLRGEREITPAADVFSLGVMGYELLAGKRPFTGDRLQPRSTRTVEPAPLSSLGPKIPPEVAAVIHRALAESPDERFPDAGAFAGALLDASKADTAVLLAAPVTGDSDDAGIPLGAPSGAVEAAAPRGPGEDPTLGVVPAGRAGRQRPPARPKWITASVLSLAVAAAAWWVLDRDGGPEHVTSGADPGRGAQPVSRAPLAQRTPQAEGVLSKPPSTTSEGDGGGGEASPLPTDLEPASRAAAARADDATPQPASLEAVDDRAGAARINREGERLFREGSLAAATDRFRQAARMAPGSAYYRNNLGWALFRMKRYDEAARELEQAARLDPRRAIVHANIGEVRWARGDREGAVAAYERFLELNSDERLERIAEEKLNRIRTTSPGSRP